MSFDLKISSNLQYSVTRLTNVWSPFEMLTVIIPEDPWLGHGSRLSKIVKKYVKRKSPSNIYQLKHTQHVMGMKIKCKKRETNWQTITTRKNYWWWRWWGWSWVEFLKLKRRANWSCNEGRRTKPHNEPLNLSAAVSENCHLFKKGNHRHLRHVWMLITIIILILLWSYICKCLPKLGGWAMMPQ